MIDLSLLDGKEEPVRGMEMMKSLVWEDFFEMLFRSHSYTLLLYLNTCFENITYS